MLTKLKKRVQSWLSYEASLFHRLGLAPNHISVIGLILSIISAIFYSQWKLNSFFLILAPVFMLLSGLFDALDGIIARSFGEVTKFGGFFDSVLDRYSDAIVLCGIVLGELVELSWGFAALIGSLLVSYARARAETVGIKMESVGIAERAERIVILAFASLLSYIWIDVLNWAIILLAVLSNFTVVQRALFFRKSVQKANIKE